MDRESFARFLVVLTDRPVIITVAVIIAFIILRPICLGIIERMHMSSIHDTMQKIAAAQINYEVSNGKYTYDFRKLDLNFKDKYGKYFEDNFVQTKYFDLTLAKKGIWAVQNKKEYFVYYQYKDSSFSCAPKEHDICKNIAPISKEICEEADMLWSDRNNSCYTREKDMCLALGLPWDEKENFCGYKNASNKEIYEGSSCIATKSNGCQNSVVSGNGVCEGRSDFGCKQSTLEGGTCVAYTETACHSVEINKGATCLVNDDYSGNYGCQNVTINKRGVCFAKGTNTLACNKATIDNGGICRGKANKSCNDATVLSGGICEADIATACQNIIVRKGGKCIANVPQTCEGTYEQGACCHGDYCPANSPKCKCLGYATAC